MNIHLFCKRFRSEVVKMSLKDMSEFVDTPISTIGNFEQGRSYNLMFLPKYYNIADTDDQRALFMAELECYFESQHPCMKPEDM